MRFALQNELKSILEILNDNPCNIQEIINSIKPLLINKWSGWQLDRDFQKIPARVEKAISYLREKELIYTESDYYSLTDKGRQMVNKALEKQIVAPWTRPLMTPKISTIVFFLGYMVLWLLKIVGYLLSGNLIFLADGFSSMFGVLTIIMINAAPRINYDTVMIRLIQIIFILAGIAFFVVGIERALNPIEITNIKIIFGIINIIIVIGLCLFLYLRLSGSVNDDTQIKVFKEKAKSDWFLPVLVLLPIITEAFEGLIVLINGLIILGEAIRINMGRYTRHVLIFLNERSYSHREILEIDSRIAMMFGAPMFMYGHNATHTWWNEKGLAYLEKKGYVKREDMTYSLTEKGKQPANDAAKQMIQFLRFITSLVRPVISPILSLLLHLFLGGIKIIGFVFTGSVGLMGDGLDSAIDGVSSIVVGIAMRIKKEAQATYFLILLMLITGITVIISSVSRILHPIALEEEMLAIMIAVLSIIICFLLYLYQRYSGYINQSLAILAQSEDSKNHVLNASLVLIAVSASYYQIYIIDGLVGCFIGFIILKGAYEVFQDLRKMSQGEYVDFEKYKLGFWKGFSKFQLQMFKNWILFQILNGRIDITSIETAFDMTFHPLTIRQRGGDDFTISYSYIKEELTEKIEELSDEELIQIANDGSYILTDKGRLQIEKAIKRHKHR